MNLRKIINLCSVILAGLAMTGAYLIPVSPVYASLNVNCPLTPQDGRTIVIFNTTQRAIIDNSIESYAEQGPFNTNLHAGIYKVTLVSFDDHSNQFNLNQPHEQWHMKFLNSSTLTITNSSTIDDIPDDQNYVTQMVDTNLTVPDNVTQVVARHSYFPSAANFNPVVPVCAAFDLVQTIAVATPTPSATPSPTPTPSPVPSVTPSPSSSPNVLGTNSNLTELPKTGTPLLAWSGSILTVLGIMLKKYGKESKEELSGSPRFIWEERSGQL